MSTESVNNTINKKMNVNTSDDDDFSNEIKCKQPLTTRRELWSYYLYYNGVRNWDELSRVLTTFK
jgi:hypothetical protein